MAGRGGHGSLLCVPFWGYLFSLCPIRLSNGCRGTLLLASQKDWVGYAGAGHTPASSQAVPCRASPALKGRSTSARDMEPGSWEG